MNSKEIIKIKEEKLPNDKRILEDYYCNKEKSDGFANIIFLVSIIMTFLLWILLLLIRK